MAHEPSSRWLVSTDWLAERLGAADIVVVDGSSYLSTMQRDGAAEYLAGHIPAAVRFDIDAIADHSNPLPHMLPDATQFAGDVGALGIADTDTIVVYDGAGLYSAPRVWWTFRLFGAEKVFILDGGLPKWKAEGRPLEAGPVARSRAHSLGERLGTGGRCAPRRALSGTSAGAAPRVALRSHARRPQCPLDVGDRERKARAAGKTSAGVRRRPRRPRGAGHHHLRLGADGRDPLVRARRARQPAQGALRRFMVGMGIARRSAGRTESLKHGASTAPVASPQPRSPRRCDK